MGRVAPLKILDYLPGDDASTGARTAARDGAAVTLLVLLACQSDSPLG